MENYLLGVPIRKWMESFSDAGATLNLRDPIKLDPTYKIVEDI